MKLRLPIRSLFKPSSISMLAVSASFAAWIFPAFGVLQKGFETPSKLTTTSVLILSMWYLLIFTSFVTGQWTGQVAISAKSRAIAKVLDLDSDLVYYTFTLLSALGITAMLVGIFRSLSLQEALLRISLGETNALKDALYEDYSVGLASLRYVVLYPASIALYRVFRWKKYAPINLINVSMLAVSTFLSSRLILIATVMTTVFLLSYGRRAIQIRVAKTAMWLAALFLILSALNISRNAAFYERNGLSFWLAGVNEIDAYLGTPFQVAVGAANATDQLVAGGQGSGADGGQTYRRYAEVGINYMTNSAFVHLHEQLGYLCWPYIAGVCCLLGFTFEFLHSMGRTVFLLPCGAILYGSAELWRLDLFQQGTFIVWLVIGLGVPTSFLLTQQLLRFFSKLYKAPGASNSHPSGTR